MVSFLLSRPEARHRTFVPPAAKYWWPELFEEIKALIHILSVRHKNRPPTQKKLRYFSQGYIFIHIVSKKYHDHPLIYYGRYCPVFAENYRKYHCYSSSECSVSVVLKKFEST